MSLIYNAQRVEGFLSGKWIMGQGGDWLGSMSKWHKEGKYKIKETFTDGIENWPHAFA